jgi:hypothetical protein
MGRANSNDPPAVHIIIVWDVELGPKRFRWSIFVSADPVLSKRPRPNLLYRLKRIHLNQIHLAYPHEMFADWFRCIRHEEREHIRRHHRHVLHHVRLPRAGQGDMQDSFKSL